MSCRPMHTLPYRRRYRSARDYIRAEGLGHAYLAALEATRLGEHRVHSLGNPAPAPGKPKEEADKSISS